jgi:hypothetical protein
MISQFMPEECLDLSLNCASQRISHPQIAIFYYLQLMFLRHGSHLDLSVKRLKIVLWTVHVFPMQYEWTDETNSSSRSLISPLLSSSNTQIKNSATFDYSTLRVPPIPTSSRLKGSSEIIPLTEDAVSLRKRALEISSHQRTGRSMSASPGDAVDHTNDSLALLQKKYDDSICQRGTSMKSLSFTRSVSAVSNYSSLDPYFRVHSPPIRGLSHYQTSTPSRLSSDLNPFSFPSSFLAPQNSQNNRLSSHHENRSGYMPSIENLSADLI